MSASDFTATILVDKTPNEAFDAINNVRGWWSEEIDRCRIKVIEMVHGQKIVWHVLDNYFKPGIFEDPAHPAPSEDGFDKFSTRV